VPRVRDLAQDRIQDLRRPFRYANQLPEQAEAAIVAAKRDKRYCYPLTVTDHASRYLILCEAVESNREELVLRAFDRLFREPGLPQAIRSDNGVPFASPQAP
jgi:transposase InsO family protein